MLVLSIHALKILNLKFQLLPPEILGKDLWNLISMCVLQPSAVGFNLGDVEIITNLPREVRQIHVTVKKKVQTVIITEISNFSIKNFKNWQKQPSVILKNHF